MVAVVRDEREREDGHGHRYVLQSMGRRKGMDAQCYITFEKGYPSDQPISEKFLTKQQFQLWNLIGQVVGKEEGSGR